NRHMDNTRVIADYQGRPFEPCRRALQVGRSNDPGAGDATRGSVEDGPIRVAADQRDREPVPGLKPARQLSKPLFGPVAREAASKNVQSGDPAPPGKQP